MAVQDLLPKLEVYNSLEGDDYKIIQKYMFNHEYDEGNYVFKDHGHGGYMFFIADGEVEIIKQLDNNRHTIATLTTGRSVGEMSLIDRSLRSATVRAKTNLKLILLKREDFTKLDEENPAIANKVFKGVCSLLSKNLRDTNNRFTEQLLSIC